jgi:Icc-related predicted phosphoesterase
MSRELTIVCVSDLHGDAYPEVPPCDILLVAGDVESSSIDPHDYEAQRQHLWGPFSRWLERAPAKHIAACAGNHDFLALYKPALYHDLPWHYLCDEAVELEGLLIHGSPWTSPFMDWAFMLPEEELEKKWALISAETDILMTHSPPYGLGDYIDNGLTPEPNVGSRSLRRLVDEHAALRLHVFGHIHGGAGQGLLANGATWVNASAVDGDYQPVHKPVVVKLRTP